MSIIENNITIATLKTELDLLQQRVSSLELSLIIRENPYKAIRRELGLTQEQAAQQIGISTRTLISVEQTGQVSSKVARRYFEFEKVINRLADIMQRDSIGAWLIQPNDYFKGRSPAEIIKSGKTEELLRMVYMVESGDPN